MALAAEGLSNAAIAADLGIKEKSVENHLGRIYDELGIERDAYTNPRVVAVRKWLDANP